MYSVLPAQFKILQVKRCNSVVSTRCVYRFPIQFSKIHHRGNITCINFCNLSYKKEKNWTTKMIQSLILSGLHWLLKREKFFHINLLRELREPEDWQNYLRMNADTCNHMYYLTKLRRGRKTDDKNEASIYTYRHVYASRGKIYPWPSPYIFVFHLYAVHINAVFFMLLMCNVLSATS